MPVPKPLLQQLLKGLDGTVNDAKERLSYCAETRLRIDVQMFEPMHRSRSLSLFIYIAPSLSLFLLPFSLSSIHSNLAYPDILENFHAKQHPAKQPSSGSKKEKEKGAAATGRSGSDDRAESAVDVYETWYPPMRHTLSLLSKLYGVVEMTVFEDFARRAVGPCVCVWGERKGEREKALTVLFAALIDTCVSVLRSGSESVKKSRGALHGDLFLVRHLLILREQLVPFEIRLQGVKEALPILPRCDSHLLLPPSGGETAGLLTDGTRLQPDPRRRGPCSRRTRAENRSELLVPPRALRQHEPPPRVRQV